MLPGFREGSDTSLVECGIAVKSEIPKAKNEHQRVYQSSMFEDNGTDV